MAINKHQKSSSRIFIGLTSFQMLAMFRRGLFYTFLSIYLRNYLNLSVTETTLYATLPMIMSVTFQTFVWGPISDKFQRRRTLIILGEILAGIGTISVWFIHSTFEDLIIAGYVIIIGLSCVEIFWSMSNIAWSALISDIYPFKERSKVMGNLTSLGGVGRIIGVTIGGFTYNEGLGFRNGFLFFIASTIMFVSTIPMLFTPEGGINPKENHNDNLNENGESNRRNTLIFIVFIISLIFINFGRNSIATTYSQFLTLDSGLSVDSVLLSFIVNTRSIATILIGFSAGFLSKKLGHGVALSLGASIGILAIIITAISMNLQLIFTGSFLIGAADVIIMASSYAIASALMPPKKRAKLFAVYNITFFLSWGLASTIISGPLIDFLISEGRDEVFAYQMSFFAGVFICLIGLFIFIFLEICLKVKEGKSKET
jgi:MFS family permease